MRYRIRALGADNAITEIMVDALDVEDARLQVEGRLLRVMAITAGYRSPIAVLRSGGRMSLLLFSQELLALLKAGLGLVEALEGLAERERSGSQRAIITRLCTTLREGKRFSAALTQQGDIFPSLYIGLVRSAEDTNDLPEALSRYIDYQKKIDTVKTRIVNASIYPAILFLVGGGVTLFLITFVVPRFASVYRDSGRALPWMSEVLLDWGRYASAHPFALSAQVLMVAIALGFLMRFLLRQGHVKTLIKVIPWLSTNLQIYELSRLYLTLSMLLKGGIPVVSALGIVRPVLSPSTSSALIQAEEQIRSGSSFSAAFEAAGLTTAISQRMLRVGERAGQLPDMLAQAAQFYDGDIERFLDRFTRTFEPLLMAAIGIVVGLIVVLLYMPIFDLAGGLQ